MSNYDIDEIERLKEKERRSRGIRTGSDGYHEIRYDDHIVAQPDTHPHPTWVYKTKALTENISLDISDQDVLQLTMIAHGRDITLNHLINEILHDKIQRDLLQHSR